MYIYIPTSIRLYTQYTLYILIQLDISVFCNSFVSMSYDSTFSCPLIHWVWVWLCFIVCWLVGWLVGLFDCLFVCCTISSMYTNLSVRPGFSQKHTTTSHTLYIAQKPKWLYIYVTYNLDPERIRLSKFANKLHLVDMPRLIFQRNLLYCTPKNRVAPCRTHPAVCHSCYHPACSR